MSRKGTTGRTALPDGGFRVSPVQDGQWSVVAWLWQAFRQDLAGVVSGLPYADGRYQAAPLDHYPSPNATGYLAWRPHPNTGEEAPIGFVLVDGLRDERRSLAALWVATVARRGGVGRTLAADVLARHAGPWSIGFQHDNVTAAAFWRVVADEAFGPGGWVEVRRPVPGRPQVPADHFIEGRLPG